MDRRKLAFVALPVSLIALWLFTKVDALREPWPIRNSPAPKATMVSFGNRSISPGSTESMDIAHVGLADMTSEQARALIDQVLVHEPGIVLLTLGHGDLEARIPLESTVLALETIIDRLQAQGILVAYVFDQPEGIGDNWKLALHDVCKRKGVLWVELGLSEDVGKLHQRLKPHLPPPA